MAQTLSDLELLEVEHEAVLGFLYLCPVGVVQCKSDGGITMINPHAVQLLLPLARLSGLTNLFAVLEGRCPELRNLAADFDGETGQILQGHRIVVASSGPGPRVLTCSLLKVSATCLVAVLQDISREVEQERQLKQNETLLATLAMGVNDFALFSLDAAGHIDSWNKSGLRLMGLGADSVIGRDLDVLCHPTDVQSTTAAEQLSAAAVEGWNLREITCLRPSGERFWCQILVAPVEGVTGGIESYAVVIRDVTERRMTGDELRRLLTTDHLTGAANRARFFELSERAVARYVRTGKPLSVIMLDLDHFKSVNDTYGHAAGDAVLGALVKCCGRCLRDGDTLARLGGEEFAVLLPGTGLADAIQVAERIRTTVASDVAALAGLPVPATVSLGCAEIGQHHATIDALLAVADKTMYDAKRAGRNQVMPPPPVADAALSVSAATRG
jgi:diguanylate cyclase (GGDEF)-like protein/PAS domain S-box-containing protein